MAAEKARALEQCERDLDVAIERLVNLRLDATDHDDHGNGGGAGAQHHDDVHIHPATAEAAAEQEEEAQRTTTIVVDAVHVPSDGNGIGIDADRAGNWAERVVEAMSSARNWVDARARAARVLEVFGASVAAALRRQNGLLKAAVRVQRRMCMEKEAANRELQRQLAACQDRVRSLETDNYALSMYLRNAQPKPQGEAITGRFYPEVF